MQAMSLAATDTLSPFEYQTSPVFRFTNNFSTQMFKKEKVQQIFFDNYKLFEMLSQK